MNRCMCCEQRLMKPTIWCWECQVEYYRRDLTFFCPVHQKSMKVEIKLAAEE